MEMPYTRNYLVYFIVITLDEMHSSTVLSLLVLFFVKPQLLLVGVGEIDERDQSAPV